VAIEQAGRLAEAAALYERILKLDGSNVIALNNYANYLANHGKDLNLALRHALRAAILAAGDPSIKDTLGYVYLKRKEPKEAIKIFERLTADFPNVALFHIHYADALRQNGDAAAAARECAAAKPALTADTEKADFKTMCPDNP
jgi:tetratricopeptide (TPR) repeat protein